jgi:hypothetical protein
LGLHKRFKNRKGKGMNGSTKIQGHVEQGCNKPLIHEKVKMGVGGVQDYEKNRTTYINKDQDDDARITK